MIRKLLFSVVFFFAFFINYGQSASNYCFSAKSATYPTLTGTTSVSGLTATDDEAVSNSISLPFNFMFGGSVYNQVKVSSNGWLTFGSTTNAFYSNTSANAGSSKPILFPLWDDLQNRTIPRYVVSGSAPNRIFKLEWSQQEWDFNANSDVISFQAWLYETTNVIEYYYNRGPGGLNNGSSGASIGIYDVNDTYLTLNNSSAAPTAQSSVFTTNINAKPASNQVYTFTPPPVAQAGPDQYKTTPFTLAANAAGSGNTGTWSIANGPNTSTSQFSDLSSPTAIFMPIGSGTWALNWTINGCNSSTDQVIISNCSGNLITNGDFSTLPTGSGWTTATSRGNSIEINQETTYFSTTNGDYTAELDSQASLRQGPITVMPGVPYKVSFLYAKRPGTPETNSAVDFRVFEGATVTASGNTSTSSTTVPQMGSFTFTPTSSSIYVEFYNFSASTTYGTIIDNIVLLPSAQEFPVATTTPKGVYKTLTSCVGTSIGLDVDNVTDPSVTYSWSVASGLTTGVTYTPSANVKNPTIAFSTSGLREFKVVASKGGCSGPPSSIFVKVLDLPTVYNVTGGGSYCSGGTGAVVGLDGSAATSSTSNISYQLQRNGVDVTGAVVTGTGSAISFGPQTVAGTYTVVAKNTLVSTACSSNMNGSVAVSISTAPTVSITGSSNICVNSTTKLSPTTGGTWVSNNPSVASVTNTGDVLGLATGTATFTFTNTAAPNCSATTAVVNVSSSSNVFDLSGSYIVPAGVTSVQVECWGAGGGGSSRNGAAGGGGGGAYTKGILTSLTSGQSLTVTVGTGGAAGVSGGISNVGTIVANGGSSVSTTSRSGGAGGSASSITGNVIASYSGYNGGDAAGNSGGGSNEAGGGGGGSATITGSGGTPGANGTNANATALTAGGIGTGAGGGGGATDGNPDAVAGIAPGGGGGGKGEGGGSSKSGANGRVTITILTPTASAGGSQTICQTGTATVSGASATNGTIVWTHDGAGSLNDATILAPTYTPGTGDGGKTITLKMTVSNGPCLSATAPYTVIVNPTLSAVGITPNTAQSICGLNSGTPLTVAETGGNGVTLRQWGKRSVSGGTITNISGENGASFIPTGTNLGNGNWFIVCTSTPSCGTAMVSNEVSVSVNPDLPASITIAASPSGAICTGSSVTFTATPFNGGTTPVYQWKLNGGIVGTNSSTYTNVALANSDIVTCVLTSNISPCGTGSPATSNALTMTVNANPTAPVASPTQPTCAQSTGTITVSSPAPGAGISYGLDGITFPNTDGVFTGLTNGVYTIYVKNGSGCIASATPITIASTGAIVWTGNTSTDWNTASNWSPTVVPGLGDCVLIPNTGAKNSVIGTDVNVHSISVNNGGSLTVLSDKVLTVTEGIIVGTSGSFVFENNSSLIQKSTSNSVNIGNITYKRKSAPVRRYDFTFWSSPVKKESAFTLKKLSPLTLADKYYSYNTTTLAWKIDYNGTLTMIPGNGYIVRAPQNFNVTATAIYPASFIGTPNNGDIEITPVADHSYLLGNPYPSALDGKKFIKDNSAAGNDVGALYFWTHNSPPSDAVSGDAKYNYTVNDYAVYSLVGGVATGPAKTGGSEPTGVIAAGQAFFVTPSTNVKIKFTNDMRIGAGNSQFFKTNGSDESEQNRLWLNFTNAKGAFKQVLVGYVEGATNGWDTNYDGWTMSGNTYLDFYSINDADKLTIQGRALPFEKTDLVPLGYVTSIAGDFTIAIDHADGVFTSQAVYLEDKKTGQIIDLRAGNYTFNTAIGTFTNRFVLRYTNKTLGTGDFENVENGILVSAKDKTIKVQSSVEMIKEVTIFDVAGKLVYNKKKVTSNELQITNLSVANQVLLVNITLENGFTTTRKVIFQ